MVEAAALFELAFALGGFADFDVVEEEGAGEAESRIGVVDWESFDGEAAFVVELADFDVEVDDARLKWSPSKLTA